MKHAHRPLLRHAFALLLLAFSLLLAGPSIHAASYGGFLFAAVLVGGVTYLCCRLYPEHPFLCGLIVATCFAISLRIDDSRMYSRARDVAWGQILDPWRDALLVYGYCLFFALVVSIVFRRWPRKA